MHLAMLNLADPHRARVMTGRHHTAANGEGTICTSHLLPNEMTMTILPPPLNHKPSIEINNLHSRFQSVADKTRSSKIPHPVTINLSKAPNPRCSKLVEALPPKAHRTLLLRSSNGVKLPSVKLPFAKVLFVLPVKAPQSAFCRAISLMKHTLNKA